MASMPPEAAGAEGWATTWGAAVGIGGGDGMESSGIVSTEHLSARSHRKRATLLLMLKAAKAEDEIIRGMLPLAAVATTWTWMAADT